MNARTFDLLELYDNGYSIENIAERLSIKPRSVHRALLRYDRIEVTGRGASVPADEFQRVWNASSSAREVTAKLGISFYTATNRAYRLRKLGLDLKLMTSHLTGPFSRGIL